MMTGLLQGDVPPSAGAGESVNVSVELLNNGQALGVLELYSSHWRFKPANSGLAERSGPLGASALGRFVEELERLPPTR